MQTVRQWLEQLGLPQYAEVFAENDVDLEAMRLLAESDLEKLGVSLGHRKKLLKAAFDLAGGLALAPIAPPIQASPPTLARESSGAEGERRHLTVLFCDMVGFTELANRVDPEVLQGIVRSYEDTCAAAITRFAGYVFQRLGDGIVAFFGYPLAHEGEAERAIRAGLEIIQALSKLDVPDAGHLAVRIGIATGLVVVSSAEKGAVGETMNLASRLQGIAPPGSIVVSERVHRLARGSFDYEDLGEKTLKGIAQPFHAYRILKMSQAASRFEAATQEGLTPLVGRDLEIELLMERWALAQDGEGQVVLLSGEPGIGKSRILSALSERLEATGAGTLRFQCSPYYVNSAFWPSIDNFERALKFARDELPESKLDKLEALIVTHYGRPLSDVRFIASMLSIPCEDRYGALPMTPQKHKNETLRTLVDLTEAAARKQPRALLYEDAHWADPTTLEVLDLLIDRIRTLPVLIVLTHRPEFESRWAAHGHLTSLNLAKLTRAQSAAIISKLAGGVALPAELVEQILTKTDGVPLFVEELTKSIMESGELKEADGCYEYSGTAPSITIPATLRDSLMARLDRMPHVKEVAQIASVIGREFTYELVVSVAPMNQTKLDAGLQLLTESGLAFRRGTPPDATYAFKHALVQEAAYDSLLRSRRQELHAAIARLMDTKHPEIQETQPQLLAHHLTAAGYLSEAVSLWGKAGELALKRMALRESISHLSTGLQILSALPASQARDTAELALRTVLGTAWMAYKGWPAEMVWTSLYPAWSLATSLNRMDALVPIFWGLAQNVLTQGRIYESLEWAQKMFDAAEDSGNRDLLIPGHGAAMIAQFWLGELQLARTHGDSVLALYEDARHQNFAELLNTDLRTAAMTYSAHWLWMLGYPEQALRCMRASEDQARERGHVFEMGWVLSFASDLFGYRSEPVAHHERANQLERLGRDNAMPVFYASRGPIRRGIALIREGKYAEGLSALEPGLALWVESGGKTYTPFLRSIVAEAIARMGDPDSGLHILEDVISEICQPTSGQRVHYAEIARLKGWMLELKGNSDAAERSYMASLEWARHQQAKSWELRTSTSLANLWLGQGKLKQAYDLLAPIYKWFTEGFDTKDLKEAKALLGELNG